MDLRSALRSRLTYAQGVILEREAPTHFTVPSGSNIPIDYLDGEIPTLSVRLQEMFGSMTKSFHPGRAAQNGLTAALLAHKGYTASEHGLEAPSLEIGPCHLSDYREPRGPAVFGRRQNTGVRRLHALVDAAK